MGKDNITFHSVIFPCSLLGTQDPYTMLHHISTTEYLNYEIDEKTGKPKKFSKSRSTGVFGDDAMKTGIPSEVWRYYLLVNRPEQQDTVFLWNDFMAKNNSELLANLGNFSNRLLKFLASPTFGGKVPVGSADHPEDKKFIASLYAKFEEYHELLEQVKLKDGIRECMAFSSLCNGYIQDNKPWDLAKTDLARCG
jgi:methionyl-tRNA synthetase